MFIIPVRFSTNSNWKLFVKKSFSTKTIFPQICDNLTNGTFAEEQEAVQKVMMMLAMLQWWTDVMKIMNKDDMKKMLPLVPFDHPHVILSRPCFNPNQFNLNGSDCSMLLYTVLWNINCVKYGVLLFFCPHLWFFQNRQWHSGGGEWTHQYNWHRDHKQTILILASEIIQQVTLEDSQLRKINFNLLCITWIFLQNSFPIFNY